MKKKRMTALVFMLIGSLLLLGLMLMDNVCLSLLMNVSYWLDTRYVDFSQWQLEVLQQKNSVETVYFQSDGNET